MRVVRVPFPNDGVRWQQITSYGKIRNWLVHQGPTIRSTARTSEFQKLINKMTTISLEDDGQIVLSNDMCLVFIETLKEFFQELFAVLKPDPPPQPG